MKKLLKTVPFPIWISWIVSFCGGFIFILGVTFLNPWLIFGGAEAVIISILIILIWAWIEHRRILERLNSYRTLRRVSKRLDS